MQVRDVIKGGFKSENIGGFLLLQNKYSKSLSWAENLNKLFTNLGEKFKFSAQDSDLEYFFVPHQTFWQKATFKNESGIDLIEVAKSLF